MNHAFSISMQFPPLNEPIFHKRLKIKLNVCCCTAFCTFCITINKFWKVYVVLKFIDVDY